MIIVFCANVSYHENDPNVLSHPEKIKVDWNVLSVCKYISEYFDEMESNLKANLDSHNYE